MMISGSTVRSGLQNDPKGRATAVQALQGRASEHGSRVAVRRNLPLGHIFRRYENFHAPSVRPVCSDGGCRARGPDGGGDGVWVCARGRPGASGVAADRVDDRWPFGARSTSTSAICAVGRQTSVRFRFIGEPPLKRVAPSLIISGRSPPPATEHFEDLGESAT